VLRWMHNNIHRVTSNDGYTEVDYLLDLYFREVGSVGPEERAQAAQVCADYQTYAESWEDALGGELNRLASNSGNPTSHGIAPSTTIGLR